MDDQHHLTDEQFTEILFGSDSTSLCAHLDVCPQCAAEAAQVHHAIGDFKQRSRLWAERRAAMQACVPAARRREPRWASPSLGWMVASLTLLLAAGVGLGVHRNRKLSAPWQAAQSQPAPTVSQATIRTDNDLLSAIDGELRVDESTSAGTYTLSERSHADRTRSPKKATSE